jgi:hypothetical protein
MTRAGIIAGAYFLLAIAAIAYELSIRIFDRGNSEFAGMLSLALTLPSSIAVASLSSRIAGVRVGDSDVAFVVILVLAAVVNAVIIHAIVRLLSRTTK